MTTRHATVSSTPLPGGRARLLGASLRASTPLYVRAIGLSFVAGLLMITPSWFMFEVYGRVLNSRNGFTLLMLLIAAVGSFVMMGLLELARAQLLQRAALQVDERLRLPLFDLVFQKRAEGRPVNQAQAFGDLRTLREFIPSAPVTAVLDLPAALIFLVLMFALGPLLGWMALAGMGLQLLLALITERRTLPLLAAATDASGSAQAFAAGALRSAPVIEAMGMKAGIHGRWAMRQKRFVAWQSRASDIGGFTSVLAKLVQTVQGSLLLGVACWMALTNQIWGGPAMMVVASILGARVLQPLSQLVGQWRSVVLAREAYARLDTLLGEAPGVQERMPLPAPRGKLSVEGLSVAAPGSSVAILKGVQFSVSPGEMVAVIGPSGSGKTTLARMVVGLWPPQTGKVRLDAVDVHLWNKDELGPHVGYLPQGIELFDGTVAENIARFGPVDMARVRQAADEVGLTQVIEDLPQGFDTRIGEDGAVLSGGQRQRLGLARAVYGQPRLLVLDEPNASLDEAGERALLQMLLTCKARGTTIVAVMHRGSLMPAVDKLMMMVDGKTVAFGPRDDVLAALKKANEEATRRQAAAALAQRRPPGSDPLAGAPT